MQSSVQFSCSVVSDSLRPHESQHARPPCPSPTPGIHADSRPSSQWCHPTISSSVVPFSSCPQSLPASKSFPMSQLFAWGGQSTGVSAWGLVISKSGFICPECPWMHGYRERGLFVALHIQNLAKCSYIFSLSEFSVKMTLLYIFNRLVLNRKRSMSRLYIVTLLI